MVQIVFTSSADITPDEAKKLNAHVLAVQINFGAEQSYRDGIDLTKQEFFEKMKEYADKTGKLPTTTQIGVEEHLECFKPLLDAGDEIVYISMSSGMSSTMDRCTEAVNQLGAEDKITIFDSEMIAFPYGALVREAVKARDAGKSREEIIERLKDCRERCELMAVVSDITYLKKGGRIKGAASVVATVLNIKPLITIRNLMVDTIGKSIGVGKACKTIAKMYSEFEVDESMPVYTAYSYTPELVETLVRQLKVYKPDFSATDAGNIGAAVGTHVGPGCVGICFFRKKGSKSLIKN